jgi:NADP-dependent 3-hydroxy acid dehydrogenase YdfG
MTDMSSRIAVVTGASSGIGAATARRLVSEGFHVIAAARRTAQLEAVAADGGMTPVTADITTSGGVEAIVEAIAGRPVELLINNAGGAVGAEQVEEADLDGWQWMFEINVLATVRITKALLPALERSGRGSIVMVSSTAGLIVYEGGGGYAAAKHAQTAVAETLRLELSGRPIRVIEIDPGMVKTDEFALKRFDGDAEKAAAIYRGVAEPLTADDVADVIAFCATRPHHVNVDRLILRPLAQAAQHKVHRVL